MSFMKWHKLLYVELCHLWTSGEARFQWALTHPSGTVNCFGSCWGTVDLWTHRHSWIICLHTPVLQSIVSLYHTCSYWATPKDTVSYFMTLLQLHRLCSVAWYSNWVHPDVSQVPCFFMQKHVSLLVSIEIIL
jgi:hypothetical protein